MSNLVGPQTLDTVSSNAGTNCRYPAKTLGGGVKASPNVYLNGKPLEYASAEFTPDPADGEDLVPAPPFPFSCLIPSGTRISINKINRSVFINGKLPLVKGDLCQTFSTERPFSGPFLPGNVFIATLGG